MKRLLLISFSFICFVGLDAQIPLDNASFEDEAGAEITPTGWLKCKKGTTPDILPGSWGVYTEPSDGETYIGLITRFDKTWESIGQRLAKSMDKDMCYSISLDLAHSKTYNNYNNPVKLRVWGGQTRCSRGQLLWQSDLIEHTYWKTYEFDFKPNATFNYIIIEAYFPDDNPTPYRGNILLDNMSAVEVCERA